MDGRKLNLTLYEMVKNSNTYYNLHKFVNQVCLCAQRSFANKICFIEFSDSSEVRSCNNLSPLLRTCLLGLRSS